MYFWELFAGVVDFVQDPTKITAGEFDETFLHEDIPLTVIFSLLLSFYFFWQVCVWNTKGAPLRAPFLSFSFSFSFQGGFLFGN